MLTILMIRELKDMSEKSLGVFIFSLIATVGFLGAALIFDIITFPFLIIGYFTKIPQKKENIYSKDNLNFNISNLTLQSYNGSSTAIDIPSLINGKGIREIGHNFVHRHDPNELYVLEYGGFITYSGKPIEEVKISEGYVEIGTSAFRNNMITDLVLPQSIRVIQESAFKNNKIRNLNLSKNLIEIRRFAFRENLIEKLDLPSQLTNLEDGAFEYNNITLLNLNHNLKIINKNCFKNNLLNEVNISNSVIEIGSFAFANNKIKKILIPESVQTIKPYAFDNNQIEEIKIEGDPKRFNNKWELIGFPKYLMPI
jgi:hypothetical protein